MSDHRIEEKIDGLTKMNYEQSERLARMEVSIIGAEKTRTKHDKMLTKLVEVSISNTEELKSNTDDLKYHIMRTDILQGRQNKIILAAAILVGAVSVVFGPTVIRIFGIFI